MSRADRRLQRFIDAIVRDRRPRRGDAGDDVDAMRLAARLHAAHPGSADPQPEFTDVLARRLRQDAGDHEVAHPTRRRVLAAAGLAAAAGVGAGFGVEQLRQALTPPSQPTVTPDDGTWVPIAAVADMRLGTLYHFSANGIEGFLMNADGRLSAVSAVCTDQGCLLLADKSGTQLNCPCHYAQFRLDGTPKPDAYHKVTPLPVIQVRTNGSDVEALVPNMD
ncbi:MAG: Rieske 2Fe-2S domain-containing protein [Candidatus Dormibacteraeota bacterium]|nr:Rieske 2Fe-2S domain-containing protein [Candidatus Dormibacteraeota bacterium]